MAPIVLLALGSVLLPGCILTAIGIGVYADTQYKQGVGTQDFEAPIQETWDACLATLDEFDVTYDRNIKLDPKWGTKLHVTGPEPASLPTNVGVPVDPTGHYVASSGRLPAALSRT